MSESTINATVDYGAAMHELTEGGRNAWTEQILHETVPAKTQEGIREVQFQLETINESVEGLETLTMLLWIDGLRLATPAELRAFAPHHEGEPGKSEHVLALGAAFFNNPDEYPEEMGWFAEQLVIMADGTRCFWVCDIMPRGGQLSWSAGTVFLTVRD